MSEVILMCGSAGAGKSTAARALEERGMVRLSIDQIAWERGIRSMPLPIEIRDQIERELRVTLLDLVSRDVDVVIDLSFWSRRSRNEYRELLAHFEVVPTTLYLATPRDVVLDRIRSRRLSHGDDYELDEDLAAAYFDQFEVPTESEGPLKIIQYKD